MEEEAISNIEKAFEHVDGRNDGSTREMKPVENGELFSIAHR